MVLRYLSVVFTYFMLSRLSPVIHAAVYQCFLAKDAKMMLLYRVFIVIYQCVILGAPPLLLSAMRCKKYDLLIRG